MLHVSTLLIGMIALLHWYICVLEMFWWEKAVRVFRIPPEDRENPKLRSVFQNLGLYNGFLAAGLTWGCIASPTNTMYSVRFFFLGCVAIAGIYGAITAQKKIFWIQTVPAVLAGLFLGMSCFKG